MSNDLSEAQRWAIVNFSQQYHDKDKNRLEYGALDSISQEFGVSRRTIQRYMSEVRKQQETGVTFPNLESRKKGRVGCKSGFTEEVKNAIIECNNETKGALTQMEMIHALEERNVHISQKTLSRYLQKMEAKSVYQYVKPALSEDQKRKRVEFVMEKVTPENTFLDGNNVVHIDEKWFFLRNSAKKTRIIPGHEPPLHETSSSKEDGVQVMFLCAVGKPHERPDGTFFDGKIGIWHFTVQVAAVRSSKNRPRGTMETKNVNVTAETFKEKVLMEGGLLEAVKSKLYHFKENGIVIQLDGAKTHMGRGNRDLFDSTGRADDWNIVFLTQPANSPDLNMCDLCVFNSLQSQSNHLKRQAKNIDDLIESINTAWQEYDSSILARSYGVLFTNYRLVLLHLGDNRYPTPHSGVRKRSKLNLDFEDQKLTQEEILHVTNWLST